MSRMPSTDTTAAAAVTAVGERQQSVNNDGSGAGRVSVGDREETLSLSPVLRE